MKKNNNKANAGKQNIKNAQNGQNGQNNAKNCGRQNPGDCDR